MSRSYYLVSSEGRRPYSLGVSSVTLALAGRSLSSGLPLPLQSSSARHAVVPLRPPGLRRFFGSLSFFGRDSTKSTIEETRAAMKEQKDDFATSVKSEFSAMKDELAKESVRRAQALLKEGISKNRCRGRQAQIPEGVCCGELQARRGLARTRQTRSASAPPPPPPTGCHKTHCSAQVVGAINAGSGWTVSRRGWDQHSLRPMRFSFPFSTAAWCTSTPRQRPPTALLPYGSSRSSTPQGRAAGTQMDVGVIHDRLAPPSKGGAAGFTLTQVCHGTALDRSRDPSADPCARGARPHTIYYGEHSASGDIRLLFAVRWGDHPANERIRIHEVVPEAGLTDMAKTALLPLYAP